MIQLMAGAIPRVSIVQAADRNGGGSAGGRDHLCGVPVSCRADDGNAPRARFFNQFIERRKGAVGRKIATDREIDDADVVAMLVVDDPVERAINVVLAN